MKEFLVNLHNIKVVIGAAGAIVALLFDSKLGPAQDDLPLRFKVILAVPVIAATFYVQRLTEDQRAATLPYFFGLFIVALIAYSVIWSLLGYTKQITMPRPWWKFWGDEISYPKVRVMGGRLVPAARNIIQSKGITAQEFFEGVAYDQDRVWSRGSRACAQAVLFLAYIATVYFYTAAIAVPVA
jgi:hypothetical protein